jgi:hypothetical protein
MVKKTLAKPISPRRLLASKDADHLFDVGVLDHVFWVFIHTR